MSLTEWKSLFGTFWLPFLSRQTKDIDRLLCILNISSHWSSSITEANCWVQTVQHAKCQNGQVGRAKKKNKLTRNWISFIRWRFFLFFFNSVHFGAGRQFLHWSIDFPVGCCFLGCWRVVKLPVQSYRERKVWAIAVCPEMISKKKWQMVIAHAIHSQNTDPSCECVVADVHIKGVAFFFFALWSGEFWE